MRKEMERTADEILAYGRNSEEEFNEMKEHYLALINGMSMWIRDWAMDDRKPRLESAREKIEKAWNEFSLYY